MCANNLLNYLFGNEKHRTFASSIRQKKIKRITVKLKRKENENEKVNQQMDEEWGLYRVLLEYGKNVQLQSRKLNKRIDFL